MTQNVGNPGGPLPGYMVEINDLRAEVERLKVALRPFAHDDLCKFTSNCNRLDSPVFGRDNAMLLISDFRAARKATEQGNAKD